MHYEQLWAPWRLAYLQGEKAESEPEEFSFRDGADRDCFLCQAVAGTQDRARHVVRRTPRCVVVLNRYPYNNGHLLVCPQGHYDRLERLSADEHLDVAETLTAMVGLLRATLKPEGFNIGLNLGHAAGAGLPGHLHWHIVPRWNGDTNFMPTLAGVKVIPQSLDALWEILRGETR